MQRLSQGFQNMVCVVVVLARRGALVLPRMRPGWAIAHRKFSKLNAEILER